MKKKRIKETLYIKIPVERKIELIEHGFAIVERRNVVVSDYGSRENAVQNQADIFSCTSAAKNVIRKISIPSSREKEVVYNWRFGDICSTKEANAHEVMNLKMHQQEQRELRAKDLEKKAEHFQAMAKALRTGKKLGKKTTHA